MQLQKVCTEFAIYDVAADPAKEFEALLKEDCEKNQAGPCNDSD